MRLDGNQVLPLDHQTAWRVLEGSFAVFSVHELSLKRRFLFEVGRGESLQGLVLPPPYSLLAVSLERSEIEASPPSRARYEDLLREWGESTENLPERFNAALDRLEREEESALRGTIEERLGGEREASDRLRRELAKLLTPSEGGAGLADMAEAPLLAAMQLVGKSMGISFRLPHHLDDRRDPVEAIAHASRVRFRRVLLVPGWWKRDCGPLLAFLEGTPVALLFDGSYRLVTQGESVVLDEALAARLEPRAVMFYRPFPERAVGVLELLRNATFGRTRELVWIVFVGVFAALLGMLVPQLTGMLIDQAIPDSDHGMVLQMGAALFASSFGIFLFQFFRGLLALRLENLADATTQGAVWDRVLALPAPFFRRYSVGDLSTRIMAISQIRIKLGGTTLSTLFTGLFGLLNLGLMAMYSPPLAGVALLLALLSVLLTSVHSGLILRRSQQLRKLEGGLFGTVVQLINGVAKLRVSGAEERARFFWGKQFLQTQRLKASIKRIQDSLGVLNEVFPSLCALVLFFVAAQVVGLQILGGQGLSTGTFLAFNSAFGTFIAGAASLSNTLVELLDINDLWKRAKPILEEPLETTSEKSDPGPLSGRVSLDRVTFRYQAGGRVILKDVSLCANPGEHIALVGASGCGKSTLFRLLLGFEQPESGMVYFDGQALASLDVRAVRRQIGTVLQNTRLGAGSIFEAIAGGALITMEEAWEAARSAGLEDDIRSMPMGMQTVVAEGGVNLSGGQRQRLAIARAFALHPRILLFDEATSALDNRTQAIVSESLDRLQLTRITIAHRLSTIRHADRIYVLDEGQIVQVGSFDELMREDGLFKKLAERQLA